ncbi:MAG: hypothetical protein V1739_08965 [Candidatus Omnitrophota bacterium]
MNNLLSKSWFRFISIILIQSFLILDIAWAGGTELNLKKNSDTLSAPVEISQQMFNTSFGKLYEMNVPKAAKNLSVGIEEKKSKWSLSQIWQSFKKSLKNNLSLLHQAFSMDKKSDDDNDFTSGLRSILILAMLTPALIALSSSLGWTGDKNLIESTNGLISYIPFKEIKDSTYAFYYNLSIQGQVVLFYTILPVMLGLVIAGVKGVFDSISNRNIKKADRSKLQSFMIPLILSPALIALSSSLSWAGEGTSIDGSIIGGVLGTLALAVGIGAVKFRKNIRLGLKKSSNKITDKTANVLTPILQKVVKSKYFWAGLVGLSVFVNGGGVPMNVAVIATVISVSAAISILFTTKISRSTKKLLTLLLSVVIFTIMGCSLHETKVTSRSLTEYQNVGDNKDTFSKISKEKMSFKQLVAILENENEQEENRIKAALMLSDFKHKKLEDILIKQLYATKKVDINFESGREIGYIRSFHYDKLDANKLQATAAWILGERKSEKAVENLILLSESGDNYDHYPKLNNYISAYWPQYTDLIDSRLNLQINSIIALGKIGNKKAEKYLKTRMLNNNNWQVDYAVLSALSELGDEKAIFYEKIFRSDISFVDRISNVAKQIIREYQEKGLESRVREYLIEVFVANSKWINNSLYSNLRYQMTAGVLLKFLGGDDVDRIFAEFSNNIGSRSIGYDLKVFYDRLLSKHDDYFVDSLDVRQLIDNLSFTDRVVLLTRLEKLFALNEEVKRTNQWFLLRRNEMKPSIRDRVGREIPKLKEFIIKEISSIDGFEEIVKEMCFLRGQGALFREIKEKLKQFEYKDDNSSKERSNISKIIIAVLASPVLVALNSGIGWAGDGGQQTAAGFSSLLNGQTALGILLAAAALISLDFVFYRHFSTKIKQWVSNIKSKLKDDNTSSYKVISPSEHGKSRLSESRDEAQKIISFLAPQDQLPEKVNALLAFGNEDLETPIRAAKVYFDTKPEVVVFAGGIGHSTQNLWEIGSEYLGVDLETLKGLSEAEIFAWIFKEELKKLGMPAEEIGKIKILLDTTSRNSQENARNSLKLLYNNGFLAGQMSIILMQKPLLQIRAGANLRREIKTMETELGEKFSIQCFNHAPYVPDISLMQDAELEEITNDALGEIERLKMYPALRFNFIDTIEIPENVNKAYYELKKNLYPDRSIESEGKLVAGLIKEQDRTRTDIDRPIQVESGEYKAGSSFINFATERYQGSLYLIEGSANAQIKGEEGIIQTIELGKGDIINLFVNSDIVFTEDSKFYIFRQTDASQTSVDHKEKLDGEVTIDSRNVIEKDRNIIADVYRDARGDLIATVHRIDMASPAKMVMTTPRSAAIGIGVKTAIGDEAAHRHELDGKSKIEIALCRMGSLTAYVGNKEGKDVNEVDVKQNELLILYPDSTHGFEFNNAKMAIIIQDPGRGIDKVDAKLEKTTEITLGAAEKLKTEPESVITEAIKLQEQDKQEEAMALILNSLLDKNLNPADYASFYQVFDKESGDFIGYMLDGKVYIRGVGYEYKELLNGGYNPLKHVLRAISDLSFEEIISLPYAGSSFNKNGRLIGTVIKADDSRAQNGPYLYTAQENPLRVRSFHAAKGTKSEKYLLSPVSEPNPFGNRPRQEVWHVLKGKIRCVFYTKDNEYIGEQVMSKGDTALFSEAHQVFFEEDSIVLEIRQGPCSADESDRQILDDVDNAVSGYIENAADLSFTAFKKENRLVGAVVKANHVPFDKLQKFSAMPDPIQFNSFYKDKGMRGTKLYHPPVQGESPFKDQPRQEVLFILKGKVRVKFSTVENIDVAEEILEAGDAVLFTEGHVVEFLEDTVFLEAKQGPYPSSGNKDDDQIVLNENIAPENTKFGKLGINFEHITKTAQLNPELPLFDLILQDSNSLDPTLKGKVDQLQQMATAFFIKGEFDKVIETIQEIIKIYPNSFEVMRLIMDGVKEHKALASREPEMKLFIESKGTVLELTGDEMPLKDAVGAIEAGMRAGQFLMQAI